MRVDYPLSAGADLRKPPRSILVPLDTSDDSFAAVKYAITLSGGRATITLFHVIDFLSLVPEVGPPDWPRILRDAEDHAISFFQKVQREFGATTPFQTAIVHGSAPDEIVEYARRHGCDLIVLAARPHHWFAWFRRQTARRVTNAAPCKIALVPPTTTISPANQRVPPLTAKFSDSHRQQS